MSFHYGRQPSASLPTKATEEVEQSKTFPMNRDGEKKKKKNKKTDTSMTTISELARQTTQKINGSLSFASAHHETNETVCLTAS